MVYFDYDMTFAAQPDWRLIQPADGSAFRAYQALAADAGFRASCHRAEARHGSLAPHAHREAGGGRRHDISSRRTARASTRPSARLSRRQQMLRSSFGPAPTIDQSSRQDRDHHREHEARADRHRTLRDRPPSRSPQQCHAVRPDPAVRSGPSPSWAARRRCEDSTSGRRAGQRPQPGPPQSSV
jgi:hypothetical protein